MVEYNGVVKRINPSNETQQKSILKCLLTPADRLKGQQNLTIVSMCLSSLYHALYASI